MMRKSITAGGFAVVSVFAQPAFAQTLSFNVAAQPARTGLAQFGQQAHLQILVSDADVGDQQTSAVRGDLEARAALKQLLAPTNLQIAADDHRTVVLKAGGPQRPLDGDGRPATSEINPVDEVVVTARAGEGRQRKVEASYAISTITAERLEMQGPTSVADALKLVPGFWVEGSGGEASGNVRVRGIPTDGYSSVAIEEDGAPIQHDAGLGFLNADQYFRLDESVERVEVVRGGPASIFTSNAPGAVINFITRKVGDAPAGVLKYEAGDTNLQRIDAWYGQPIGDWKASIGGFYRHDDTVRDPGFSPNEGGQIHAWIGRDFSRGKIEFDAKYLDDKVGFTAPFPVTENSKGDVVSVPGLNASNSSIGGPETEHLTFRTKEGPQDFDLTQGTHVKVTQLSARFDYDLGAGWNVQNVVRVRNSDTLRNGIFPFQVADASAFLAMFGPTARALSPGSTSAQLRYVDAPGQAVNPATLNGNGLASINLARSFSVPEREILDDLRFVNKFDLFGQTHDVAVGLYYARVSEEFRSISAALLQDVGNHSRLLDIVGVNAAGQVTGAFTDNGVLAYGTERADGAGSSNTYAAYASDEWQVTRQLRIDGGVRLEKIDLSARNAGTAPFNLGQTNTAADKAVLDFTGVQTRSSGSFQHTAWTVGADWQFDPSLGVFARYTSTYRLPGVSDLIDNSGAAPIVQTLNMTEFGLKYARPWGDLYATLFQTKYNSYSISDVIVDPATLAFTNRTVFGDTDTKGLELDGFVHPVAWFDLNVDVTLQDAKFSSLKFSQVVNGVLTPVDETGNQLLRVPRTSYRLTPALNLLNGRLRTELDFEYYGKRFADAANEVELPSYDVLNFNARFNVTDQLSVLVYADNLTNSLGLTEGNPRQGQITNADVGQRVFIARPILGRSFRAALRYRF